MTISTGDHLPDATLMRRGENGVEKLELAALLAGRKVVIFALPGAYTPTCHTAHVPSFIRVMADLKAKGVDEVICLAGNDPFVMQAWGESTGANAAGISMLSDADGSFAKAIGMEMEAPAAGLYGRSKRYAMAVEDGVITVWHPETGAGCEISGGEAMRDAL